MTSCTFSVHSLTLSNFFPSVGQTKSIELFFFFGISDAAAFKHCLASDIQHRITSVLKILAVHRQPITAVNIGFSASGLRTLGIDSATLNMGSFDAGQWKDASFLGDSGTNWRPEFAGTSIHGLFILQSDTIANINHELYSIKRALGNSVVELYQLRGELRPGDQAGHERELFWLFKDLEWSTRIDFGYLDGISQPAISGFTKHPLPGQVLINPDIFLLGKENGDTAWAKDSSFLAFRQLQQKVRYLRVTCVGLKLNCTRSPNSTPTS